MLTRLRIRNFKKFDEVEVDLASPVLFIGPNNSGKTSAMQALALWSVGLKRWNEKRAGASTPTRRPGVAISRRDLLAVPVPFANLLWRDLHVRDVRRVDGRLRTSNVRIEIVVDAVSESLPAGSGPADAVPEADEWRCGLEFDYANEESFYCRPLRLSEGATPERMTVPEAAADVRVAFLPPMSGLAATETRLDGGAVDVRIGEGRTAEVLRNLCYRIYEEDSDGWGDLVEQVAVLFGAELDPPRYVAERGEITMSYSERGVTLDLSSAGRGLQQTLLILAYMYANPGAVLLLDEPDAHLEILRQRQIYERITSAARNSGSQVIAASHSEVLLNEAAGNDSVVAFVGRPHRIDNRKDEVLKSLREIGFEQYYQAEQTGWVLYLEGSTDLDILRAFARRVGHDQAIAALERPFVRYVKNVTKAVPPHYFGLAADQAEQTGWVLYLEGSTDLDILRAFARRVGHDQAIAALERPFVRYVKNVTKAVPPHYFGLREALPSLRGVAIFDRLDGEPPALDPVECHMWSRCEIENYLCTRAALEEYAKALGNELALGPLFTDTEPLRHLTLMREAIAEVETALVTLHRGSPWSDSVKASDDVLAPILKRYFKKLSLPNRMPKRLFHELVKYLPVEGIDEEVHRALDAIARVASLAEMSRPTEADG